MPGPGGSVVKQVTVADGAQTDVMTDTEYEYPVSPMGNRITVAATVDTADADATLSLKAGQRNIAEEAPVNERQDAAGTGVNSPLLPEDIVTRGAARPGERIRVILKNNSGASRTFRVNVQLD